MAEHIPTKSGEDCSGQTDVNYVIRRSEAFDRARALVHRTGRIFVSDIDTDAWCEIPRCL